MTKSRSFLLVIVSLVAVSAASFLTLEHNLSAGIYPIDADSIGLPLIGGVITSLQLLVLLAVAILLPKSKFSALQSALYFAV